jgi:hypothetical protein
MQSNINIGSDASITDTFQKALVEYMDGRLAQHELYTQQGQLDPYLQTKH